MSAGPVGRGAARAAAWIAAGALAGPAPAAPPTDAHTLLERLADRIAALPADEPMPVDRTLEPYLDRSGIALRVEQDDDARTLQRKRPPGLSDAEWRAFVEAWSAGAIAVESESGGAALTFLDLDEDGRRDLILDQYVGGTGLYSYLSTLRNDPATGYTDGGATFSINGRGGDQAVYWLRIDGRSYVAYRDSVYGRDTLTLQRPMTPAPVAAATRPALVVRYRYRHRVLPATADARRDDAVQTALDADADFAAAADGALAEVRLHRDGSQRLPDPEARCPAPPGTPADEDVWPWHGAGHYSFDFAAIARVRTPRACYAATVIAFRSSYLKSHADCCMLWVQTAPGDAIAERPLHTQRWREEIAVEWVDAGDGE
ncbi:hypothetical protein [Lysobacter antibioticus]|uniref:hypothetical protein n=1 Tax=Lysobacter antibioticus TaxID=84531 RepID=UPI00034535AE|nr:hypothetical protein [Lysobacter antibioticus]